MTKKSFILLISGIFMTLSLPVRALQTGSVIDLSLVVFPTHHNTLEVKPAPLANSYQTAAICFLGGNCDENAGFNSGNENMDISNAQRCHNEGYSGVNCNSMQIAYETCPYDSNFAKECRCRPGLVSCASSQIGVGDSCDGKYASCVCPNGVSVGSYGCQEYYSSPCASVCKTAKNDNCTARVGKTCSDGCSTYYSDCASKCEVCKTPPINYCDTSKTTTSSYGCDSIKYHDCVSRNGGKQGVSCNNCINGYELKGVGCVKCADGKTSVNHGPCYLCPSGSYCSNGSLNKCSPGSYCSNPVGTTTEEEMNNYKFHCPDATWSDAGASKVSDCYACPAGNFCFYFLAPSGLAYTSGKFPCVEGRYCPTGSTSNPDSPNYLKYCGAGKWSNASATKESDCFACPAGSYCFIDDVYKYAVKLKCPTGTTSPAGSSSINDCK